MRAARRPVLTYWLNAELFSDLPSSRAALSASVSECCCGNEICCGLNILSPFALEYFSYHIPTENERRKPIFWNADSQFRFLIVVNSGHTHAVVLLL